MLSVVPALPAETAEVVTFEDFWTLWPRERRVEKKAATAEWKKLSAAQQVECLTALVSWRKVWAKEDARYIKHPHRWLRDERWTDELPQGYESRPLCQADFKPREETERAVMPDHVRQAIARLRT